MTKPLQQHNPLGLSCLSARRATTQVITWCHCSTGFSSHPLRLCAALVPPAHALQAPALSIHHFLESKSFWQGWEPILDLTGVWLGEISSLCLERSAWAQQLVLLSRRAHSGPSWVPQSLVPCDLERATSSECQHTCQPGKTRQGPVFTDVNSGIPAARAQPSDGEI